MSQNRTCEVVETLKREKLRVAVVGLGKMGLLHASILNALNDVELKALCDKSALILRFSKKVFVGTGVKITSDLEKLSDLDLDVVYVTTPIFSHSIVVKKVYSIGIARNLFVEKTLASSYDEAKELCELAHHFDGTNMVGYMKRFAVVFRKAKDLLAQGILGDVFSFEAYAYSSDFLDRVGSSKASAFRGGALRDLGCHVVDLALWFFGDLQLGSVKLHSVTGREFGNDRSIDFSIKMPSGLEGQFSVSQCMEDYRMPEVGFRISGSKGTMKVNDDKLDLELHDGKSLLWHRHDLDDTVDFWLGEPEYFREDQHFVRSVLEGKSAEPNFHDASRVDQIIDQVRHEGSNK